MAMWQIIVAHVVGGILATMGGIAAIWYQAKKAREIRIDEIMAEKQVEAKREAHKRIELLRSRLMQQCNRDVLTYMDDRITWMLDRRPYLPALFYDNWMSIRSSLREATTLEATLRSAFTEEELRLIDAVHHTVIGNGSSSHVRKRRIEIHSMDDLI